MPVMGPLPVLLSSSHLFSFAHAEYTGSRAKCGLSNTVEDRIDKIRAAGWTELSRRRSPLYHRRGKTLTCQGSIFYSPLSRSFSLPLTNRHKNSDVRVSNGRRET